MCFKLTLREIRLQNVLLAVRHHEEWWSCLTPVGLAVLLKKLNFTLAFALENGSSRNSFLEMNDRNPVATSWQVSLKKVIGGLSPNFFSERLFSPLY